MKKTVLLYPGLSISHFVPMMKLADVLLEEGYDVTVVLIDSRIVGGVALADFVDCTITSKPSIIFHMLPWPQNLSAVIAHGVSGYLDTLIFHNEPLHKFLSSLPPQTIQAIIIDALSVVALEVTKSLRIPAYTFYSSNASSFAVTNQLPFLREAAQLGSIINKGDTHLAVRGVPPIPISHIMRDIIEDPESKIYPVIVDTLQRSSEASGILVNTFTSMEPLIMSALSDPCFLPMLPPLYSVGPLISADARGSKEDRHECLAWLDKQPERSVVFLCFGSIGVGNHTTEQLNEIAVGLENSGHRFLWVLRAPLSDDSNKPFDSHANLDVEMFLPEGFLERTKGRGLVIKHWAPQVEVLHHKATGAFVTHCGWNSVLEAITAGVPMLCWPLYGEQDINMVVLVEEARIGVEMVGWQQGLIVSAKEVEAKVRLIMDSEEGRQLRARVAAHMEAAAMAWKEGGSSRTAFGQFLSHADTLGQGTNMHA